jgi:hypothetical protein
MPSRSRPPSILYLSYTAALAFWNSQQLEEAILIGGLERKARNSRHFKEQRRRLATAQARGWASSAQGQFHSQAASDFWQNFDPPLPDHSLPHPSATSEDIRLHLHKAVDSIGLASELSAVPLSEHPAIQREYELLHLRFESTSVPSKARIALFAQVYLTHLRLASRRIDQVFDQLEH